MRVFNLTLHPATPDQIKDGLVEPSPEIKEMIKNTLIFETLPILEVIYERAEALALMVPEDCEAAMLGGAPYLMAPLEKALLQRGIKPLYSFAERVSIETVLPSGEVSKTSIFRHRGWVCGG